MKRVLLLLLNAFFLIANAQDKECLEEITIREYILSRPLDYKASVTQFFTKGNRKRFLIPFSMNSNSDLKFYLLNDFEEDGTVRKSQYIISKKGIPTEFDLFLIKMNALHILYFDAVYLFGVDQKNQSKDVSGATIVKYQNKELDLNSMMDNGTLLDLNGELGCFHFYWIVKTGDRINKTEDIGQLCLNDENTNYLSFPSSVINNENCKKAQSDFEGNPVSLENASSIVFQTETKKYVNVSWLFFIQSFSLVGFSSQEKGVLKKVGNQWQWDSLIHQSITKEIVIADGAFKCNLISATSAIDKYFASIELKYAISMSFFCNGKQLFLENIYQSKSTFSTEQNLGLVIDVQPVY